MPNVLANNTVLVIDDQAAEIHLLAQMLTAHGYQVAGALNGHDGLALALKQVPRVILLDLHMPVINGIATAKLLQASPQLAHVPILFITGADDLSQRLEAFEAGASDYITKPFAAAEVLARIRVHARLHKPQALALEDAQAEQLAAEPPGQRLVRHACDQLQSNLRNPPTSKQLANSLGTNEKRLNEEFRRWAGRPISEQLRKLRHEKACELLSRTDLSVRLIAAQTGFNSAAAFSFSFHKHMGQTPKQFRSKASLGSALSQKS